MKHTMILIINQKHLRCRNNMHGYKGLDINIDFYVMYI